MSQLFALGQAWTRIAAAAAAARQDKLQGRAAEQPLGSLVSLPMLKTLVSEDDVYVGQGR